jgi:hypothetical protein
MAKEQITIGFNVFITLEEDSSKNMQEILEKTTVAVSSAISFADPLGQTWVEREVQFDPKATIRVNL